MTRPPFENACVVEHRKGGGLKVIGIIVILTQDGGAWIAESPRIRGTGSRPNARRHHWPKPKRWDAARLLEVNAEDQTPRYRFEQRKTPPEWDLTDAELQGSHPLPTGMLLTSTQRMRIHNSRDKAFAIIEPILKRYTREELLEGGKLSEAVNRESYNSKTPRQKIYSLLSRYLYSGMKRGSLAHQFPTRPGQSYTTKPTGRPKRHFVLAKERGEIPENAERFVCGENERAIIRSGWKKYVVKDVSLRVAYERFLNEYFAESIEIANNDRVKVSLKPEWSRPSIAQFRRHGPALDQTLRADRLKMGENFYNNNKRPTRGNSRHGVEVVGELGSCDSTSTDFLPCSSASRLITLSQAWVTRLHEQRLNYILSAHIHFQRPSALTYLRTLVIAAEDKVNYAARYGINISSRDWIAMLPRRIRIDNGEGKSVQAMVTTARDEVSSEYTPLNTPIAKAIVESGHAASDRQLAWLLPSTNFGKMRGRGDQSTLDSYISISEFAAMEIERILEHNNVTPVPHLLDIEMRREGVEATRKSIMEYMIATGRVASFHTDIREMKKASLPRLIGKLSSKGVELFDPRKGKNRLIPDLLYKGNCIDDVRILFRSREEYQICSVSIDPSYIGIVHIQIGNLWNDLQLATGDPNMHMMTLVDWLSITDHDKYKIYLGGPEVDNTRASRQANITDSLTAGKKEQKKEIELQGNPTKSSRSKGRRAAAKVEAALIENQKLGVENLPDLGHLPTAVERSDLSTWEMPQTDPMIRIREMRRTKQ